MLRCIRFIAFLLTLLVSANLYGAAQTDDVRVIIDVSGSMKKTDPANLRVAAMKLLNGLIPTGSHAGVWTFGKYVDMTVKWGTVDDNWRKLADIGVEEIHSNSMLTNIESALDRASRGWEKPDPKTRRNLILLTDGQVDIGKNKDKNAASRQKILDESLQRLQQMGVHIQAIALSKNADEDLLKRLALETEGSFEIAEKADDLQRIFFKMFERATEPDSISLAGNQFMIDSSVKEMTLLVFRKPGSPATHVYPPKSSALSAKRPGNAIWRSDDGYDLITIKNPRKGQWNIEADVDPDNRLMVVTDLQLELTGIPAYVLPNQAIEMNAALFNKGKQISKNSFLRFVKFKLVHIAADGSKTDGELAASKVREQKGQYLYQFKDVLVEGTHSIMVTADGNTFNRSKRIDMNVQWPVDIAIEAADVPGSYTLSIEARAEYLKPESLKPKIDLKMPDGSLKSLELIKNGAVWRTRVETEQDGLHQARINIVAQTQAGEPLELDLGEFSMIGVYRAPAKVDETSTTMASEDELVNEAEMLDDGPDWVRTSIVIGASNLFLVLVVIAIFVMMKRKKMTPAEYTLD